MTKKNDPPPPQPPAVRELDRFERAKSRLALLRHANEGFFEELEGAVEEYNDSREQAEQAVRGRGVSMGDFKISREFDEFDADKLFELVGRDKFLEWGGAEKTERRLSVDKVKLRSYVTAGKVPKAVVDQILTKQRQYTTPKPLRLV